MAGSTSVPSLTYTDAGYLIPAESDIVAGLEADFNAAMGGNMNTDPDTPQGQLIASMAAIIGDCNNNLALLFNLLDPPFSSGRMQDALGRLYFMTRTPPEPTTLQILCTGREGTVIPASIASIKDGSGNVYICTGTQSISSNGTVIVSFAAENNGPIAVPASGDVKINSGRPGWDTVTVSGGAVGVNVESRTRFEARRKESVAGNAIGVLPSIKAAVLAVPDVIDAYATENYTASTQTIKGVALAPHSLYVCVAGGAAADVAKAIWSKKMPGCSYNGNTTQTVYDTSYPPPYPSYAVTWQTPSGAAISFNVIMASSATVPANAEALVQAAIQKAFQGLDGDSRQTIGSTVYASRYYAGVASLGSWAKIIDMPIGCSLVPTATFTGVLAGTALTVTSVTGAIASGQFVYGAGVAPGTIIVSGTGTNWVVSVSQTVASEAMSSTTANQNTIDLQINWLPTLQDADIHLSLV